MTFYGERFRRPDEEDIWEELKQMLLNPPSEQEIALKKQQEQAWIDSILNKAFPENPNAQTEQTLKTNNSSISPMGTSNQNTLEGFGQNSINGFTNKKKQNDFPDLGKSTDYKNGSFAPVYDEEEKEMRKNYFRDPNQNIVIDEIEGPFIGKKKKPKYEAEEPVYYEEMPDEDEDTTSEELETSEETEEGNSKEEPEETSSELQDEPYLRYEDLLPDETDEEREAREARELEAFNKAWDKANGVEEKDADGVPTGGAADISEKIELNQHNNDTFFENERKKKTSIMMKINGELNSERPDAKLLMDIALVKPKNVPSCNDYQFISSKNTKNLNEKYKLEGNKKIDSWYDGFEFSKDAPTAQRLNASTELKKQILDSKNFDSKNKCFKSDKLEIEFKNDKNLQYSFGHMTLINPKITKDGYIEGVGYDKYNYDYHYNNYKKEKNIPQDIKTTLLNNSATSLQKLQHLKNYFIFVPVRIKLEEDDLL